MQRLTTWVRDNTAAAGALAVVGVIALGIMGWLFQPWQLFLDTEVSEAFPVVEPASSTPDAAPPMPAEVVEEDQANAVPSESMAPDEVAQEPMPTEPVLVASGTFVDRSHPTSGEIGIYRLPDGSHILRVEGLDTDNGPDLFVYLSTADVDAPAGAFDDEFANLGRLKGNIGDQNYELPADVSPDGWATVAIWCDRFDVIFGAATLTAV